MADLGQIDVRIGADTKRLEQGLKKSKGELTGFGKLSEQTSKVYGAAFDKMKLAAIGFGVTAGIALGKFLASTIKLSSDLAETQSKFNTVFDSSSEKVNKLTESFGILSKGEAQGFLATTGAILRGAGLAGEEVDNLASQVGELARDFSSFNNVPVAETFGAINAAITGEREQLKRLGIVLNEAEVQQRALADSGKKSAKELTQQEKAVATLALITQKATVQVGDYGRTSDSTANQIKQLQTTAKNLQEEFAARLAPTVSKVVGYLKDIANSSRTKDTIEAITTSTEGLADAFINLAENIDEAFGESGEGHNRILSTFQENIKNTIILADQLAKALSFGAYETTSERTDRTNRANASVDSAIERFARNNVDRILSNDASKGRPPLSPEQIEALVQKEILFLTQGKRPTYGPTNPLVYNPPAATTPITTGGGGGGGSAGSRLSLEEQILKAKQESERFSRKVAEAEAFNSEKLKESFQRQVDKTTNLEIMAGLAELTGENMANISEAVNDIDLNPFLEQIGKVQVKLTDTQKLLGGAFANAIVEATVLMADSTASIGERLAAIGNVVKSILIDLGKTLVLTELASLIGSGKVNPVKLISGIGAIIAAGQIKTSTPDVNKSFGKATTQGSQLVASVGVDQIHFAIERYKSENFLA